MKKMYILLILILFFLMSACRFNNDSQIVATMFSQYDAAKIISGDKLKVSLLTKPGDDAHDFEPTSKQLSEIKRSKLFLYTSYEMDTWLNRNVKKVIGKNTIAINVSSLVGLSGNPHEDLHFWAGTNNYLVALEKIKDEIIKLDSVNKNYYEENYDAYNKKLKQLDDEILAYLKEKKDVKLYFSGHNGLESFSNHYKIKVIALSSTNKPDADLSVEQIKNLINEIKNNNVSFLFTEELKEPRVARTIQRELKKDNIDLNLLELHGYHNLSAEDFKNNISYYDILKRNFVNIKICLGDN